MRESLKEMGYILENREPFIKLDQESKNRVINILNTLIR